MDYINFCKQFFAATGIPVNLLKEGKPVYSSLGEILSYLPQETWPVYPTIRNPEFSAINPDLEYGHVKIEGTTYDLFLGPVFITPMTDALVKEYFEDSKTPAELQEQVAELLYSIPIGSHPQFIRYLLFLHLCLNHQLKEAADFYIEEERERSDRNTRILTDSVEAKENEIHRNTYDYERRLYHLILHGDTARLKTFLEKQGGFPSEGKLARTPLRHTKNFFLSLTAKVGMMAAQEGCLDVEHSYRLTDLYMLECEQMQTIEEVHKLQYIMLMDFCHRCGAAGLPRTLSTEIRNAAGFIQNHTNEAIGVVETAAAIHRSPSWLMHRFKAEMGESVGSYIIRTKMDEACELLAFSQQSLAEISAYLGFSSQSYFQNVFKKQFGMTPLHYRKQNQQLSGSAV